MPSTLTQKVPADAIRSHRSDVVMGKNPTSGGSRETEVNDPTVKPTGWPSTIAVTTVTPVGKWPSTRRYFSGSIDITLDCIPSPRCVDSRVALTAVARCAGDGQGRPPTADAHGARCRRGPSDPQRATLGEGGRAARVSPGRHGDGVRGVRHGARYGPAVRQVGCRGQASRIAPGRGHRHRTCRR